MKRIILSIALMLATTFGALATMPTLAFADTAASKAQVCQGLGEVVDGANCTKEGASAFNKIIKTVLNVFSTLVGTVSVFMIIFGGFKYITSGGDSSKVTSAKNTIIYALVGLVIVVFAQIIVKFVIDKATTATKKPTTQLQQQNHQQIGHLPLKSIDALWYKINKSA